MNRRFTARADMHVEAAVVQGQFAPEGDLRQFLLVQRLAGLLEQGLEQAAFGNGQGELLLVDADYATHRAETQVAQFHLARGGGRVTAAQHGSQARGQLTGIARFGQVVVGAEFEAENSIKRLATG